MVLVCGAHANQAAVSGAPNPVLESRVKQLAQELRCLVCQNQTIADSQAPLAIELKQQIHEKLAQGLSDKDVIDFMVQRYGDFILYRPPLKNTTWLLWFGPFLLLVLGLFFLFIKLRQKSPPIETLLSADLARASVLLAETPGGKPLS